ncbi:helix-turn-helix domain-containing protein [Cryobacterium sp. PH31-AA6]|uniref:helix-turn-helix domain-containing protein n=1 Tax=Cryobacterium sp. PH31-AA6 TaxID=3046205 RepID=UPI0024B902D4|nr:helix-turn-helix domain-containing protein [Cryobacterium sp. PH31-AA6]MDJ0324964.1 helix-turn-helix domain-containing protein [Cryobacterium sp. PH31-AA6]
MAEPRAPRPPLAYSVVEAAEAIGISASKLEQIIARGDIAPRWIDGKRILTAVELLAYLDSLPFDKPE